MKRALNVSQAKKLMRLGVVASVTLSLFYPACVHADTPISAAPPISADSAVTGAEQGTIDQTTVFSWTQVPKNQTIALTKATFDKGGYQLYDTSGDTILVPFACDNLYVMRFARSNSDTMYFENQADTPVLYIPVGGYLENATVPGARWCPITDNFQPTTPVYMGIAPSWDDFIGMGWFAGCICEGGYYCDVGFGGGSYVPCPGYIFVVGNNRCFGWNEYRDYCIDHDPHFHTGYFDRTVYTHPGNDSQRFAASGHHDIGTFQPNRFSSDGRQEISSTKIGLSGSSHGSNGDSHNLSGQTHGFNGGSHSSGAGGNSSSSNSSSAVSGSQSFGSPFGDPGRSDGGSGGFDGGGHSFGGGFGGGGGGFGGHGR